MKFQKMIALTLSLALLVSLLAACGGTKADTSSDGGASERAESSQPETEANDIAFDAEENTIRFSLPAGQIRNAHQILAQELGYYEEEGVHVEFVNVSGTDALAAITTNQTDIDILGTGIVPDLTFISNGSDLVFFAGTAVEGSSIIARPEDVEYYKDLKNYAGTTFAMMRNQTSWIVTRAKLVEAGVDIDSINIMEVDSQINVAQAVSKGAADVGVLPLEYAAAASDLHIGVVYEVGELEPNYVCCRQVTSPAKLEEKHDAFVKFTVANLRAWEYYEDEANRADVLALLARQSGQTEEFVNQCLFINRTLLSLDPNTDGIVSFYHYLSDSGILKDAAREVEIEDYIDTSVYEEALQILLEREPDNAFFQEVLETYRRDNHSSL